MLRPPRLLLLTVFLAGAMLLARESCFYTARFSRWGDDERDIEITASGVKWLGSVYFEVETLKVRPIL